MGYNTKYTLEINSFKPKKEIKNTSIDELIEKLKSSNPSKDEILADILNIKNPPRQVTSETIIEDLRNTYPEAQYAIDEHGKLSQESKWYEHEEDLKTFSKKYPDFLFTLHGQGEENEDIWKKYFLNGRSQFIKAKIIFDEFDINTFR